MKKPTIKNIIESKNSYAKGVHLTPEQVEKLKTASGVILAVLAAGGAIALSAIAPNIIGAMGQLFVKRGYNPKRDYKAFSQKTAQTIYYLKRSGLIKIESKKSGLLIALTKLGKKKIQSFNLNSISIPKPAKWRNKWWLVAADIPTKDHRWGADLLRKKLKELNFYPLQRTLWLYPHNPQKELDFILHSYSIENFVTLMEVSRLDADDKKRVLAHFKKLDIL